MQNETNIEQAQIASDNDALVIYTSEDGKVKLDVQFEGETVWLSQDQLAMLFDKAKSTISYHISNIFKDGELDENVVVRKNRITTQHGAMEGNSCGTSLFDYVGERGEGCKIKEVNRKLCREEYTY